MLKCKTWLAFRQKFALKWHTAFLSLISICLLSATNVLANDVKPTYPIWSQLTNFELATLKKVSNAKQGDANSLLMLYLVASGDSRSFSKYHQHLNTINSVVKKIKPQVDREKSHWRKGLLIHNAMHQYFFLKDKSTQDTSIGYSYYQSQLSNIFYTKRYNCVSSALLYTILARKFNLDVKGVLLPSHIFVQLNLPNGRAVDIETTSISGYDWLHDENFYQKKDLTWFDQRGLTPSTYSDYQARKIVSPFTLGIQNMYNQHTFEGKMDRKSRLRIAEMRVLFDSDNVDTKKNLLVFYNNEAERLNSIRDYNALDDLFTKTAGYFESSGQYNRHDKDVANMTAWLDSQRAFVALLKGREAEAIGIAQRTLQQLDERISDREQIKNNIYVSLNKLAQERTDEEKFRQALDIYQGEHLQCMKSDHCSESIRYLYANWGSYYWNKKQWPKAILKYSDYLTMDTRGKTAEVFKRNIQFAYVNWANEYLKDGNWLRATLILNSCIEQDKLAKRCLSDLEVVKQQYQVN